MIVSIEVPDQFAKQFRLDHEPQGRALLEAFLLQQYAQGELTAGQVGEVLGLSFHETAKFLHDHDAPGLTLEQHREGVRNLDRLLSP